MKVLFFIPNLVQGGAERQILELINRLPERIEPVLCLYEDRVHYRHLLPAGQPRHVLGCGRMTPLAFARLVRIMKEERPQIVHSYLDRANLWGRLAALRAGVPVIISSCRARMMAAGYLMVERLLSDRCQLVMVNSAGIKDELTTVARVRPDRVKVIHNFLNLTHFRPPVPAERIEARERWGVAGAGPVLLMPGRLSVQKHQVGLMRALHHLVGEEDLPSGTTVLLAGRGRRSAVGRLVRHTASGALSSMVRVLGSQEEIRSLYWAADLLLLPSLWEGLPNAVLEGCACGLPSLISRSANLDEIIQHGLTGWEVPTGDRAALTRALGQILGRWDGRALHAMGLASRARVEQRFSPDKILDQVLSTYDSLIREVR